MIESVQRSEDLCGWFLEAFEHKMSSIMDKGKLPAKMFLRSNSFQKLCSLAHPMRLRGFKSNREALKSVFESLIVTTRGVIQSVTYRILCFLFLTPFTKLVGRPLQGIVAAVATTKDGDSKDRLNTVRLILKLTLSMIVSTDKPTDASCDNEAKLSEDVDLDVVDSKEEADPRTATVTDSAVQTDLDPEPEPEYFDCKEPTEPRPRACRFLESTTLQRPRRTPAPTRLALSAVYGCVLGCALQLSTLVYLLCGDAVRFPPGLIFLISALAYIGFVMMRIFTTSPTSDDRRKMATPANKKTDRDAVGGTTSKALVPVPEGAVTKYQPKGLHPILAAVSKRIVATLLQFQQPQKSIPSDRPRMSRSRSRMLLCADDKTISKVKIL